MARWGNLLLVAISFIVGALTAKQSCNKGNVLLQKRQSLHRSQSQIKTEARDAPDLPDAIYFDAVIHDFTAEHPDFQSFDGFSEGLVESELGSDKKPVYRGGPQLSNKSNFDQWYRDTPGVNKRIAFDLIMMKTEDNTYVHDSDNFFPIDGRGWGDSAIALDGQPHNFYFTLELHTTFPYRGGEVFTFKGDDDVWVFINGKLVIDIGGVHDPMERTVAIDSLNLTKGAATELSFFFAERRCCGSKFRIETTIMPVTATCTIWGDPHIDVFDNGVFGKEKGAPVDILTSGDYWLVKNDAVQIQARYGTTPFTVDGQAALVALAVTGPFLRNHTLIVEPVDDGGKVTWDNEEILKDFPSEFLLKGFVKVKFGEGKKHIDDVLSGYPVKLLRAYMPRNVQLTVNRWPKHIDAIIKMPQQIEGQDGHCGNYNFDPTDDTRGLILDRSGPVSVDESLFEKPSAAPGTLTTTVKYVKHTLSDCDPKVRAEAEKLCGKTGQPSQHVEACIFDVCFAGADFAVEDALLMDSQNSQ